MNQRENIKFLDHIDIINMNVMKKNLFIANLTSLDSYKFINSANIDIMNLLCDLYLKEDYPSTYLTQETVYNDTSYSKSGFTITEYNPFGLLMQLKYEKNDNFNIEDPLYGINSNFNELLHKLKSKNFLMQNSCLCNKYDKDSSYTTLSAKVNFVETKNTLAENLLNLNDNLVVFNMFLNILKEEYTNKEDFQDFIYNNDIFNQFIKNDKIYNFINFMQIYDLDINKPNEQGIYPIMLVKNLNSLMNLCEVYPNIDFSVVDKQGLTVQHHFTDQDDSIKMINYIKPYLKNRTLEDSKKQTLDEFLMLVEKSFTKADLQQFIKSNQLSNDDLSTIVDSNNSNLGLIVLKQDNIAKFELFKNISNFTNINNQQEGILEYTLTRNFREFREHVIKYQNNVFKHCLPFYKDYHNLSFNILNIYNDGEKTPNHFGRYSHSPMVYVSDLSLLNNIFNEDSSEKLITKFLNNTIKNENLKAKFLDYFTSPLESRNGTKDFDFLIAHFIENQHLTNKTFLDFSLNSFVDKFDFSPRLNSINDNKVFMLKHFSSKISDYYAENTLNFRDFMNNTISSFVSDIDYLISHKKTQYCIENKGLSANELKDGIQYEITSTVFQHIELVLPHIFSIQHPSLPKLIKLFQTYNNDENIKTFINYAELNQTTTLNDEQLTIKKKMKI